MKAKPPTQEQLERYRARQRERINRLRADPVYRASENEIERKRHAHRYATDDTYRMVLRERSKMRKRKERATPDNSERR